MVILPLSASTASAKLRTILLSIATAVALSAGELLLKDGATTSAVVNERLVVSLIPA